MATIFDVAARAGVSIKTVSRVLNRQGNVNAAMRDRVQRAVEALNYTPNLAARQLSSRKSYLICMLVYGFSGSSYFPRLIVSAANECRKHGYHLISETFDSGESKEDVIQRITSNLRPDGIILPPPLCDDDRLIAAIEQQGTSLVRLAGTGTTYGRSIEVHARLASRQLVNHLIELGHRRIALIAAPANHRAAVERIEGYHDALSDAKLPLDPSLIVEGDFSYRSGVDAAAVLFALPDRPTAVFAANDTMALGAMAVAARSSLRVPEDVAIAGFDDTPAGRMVYPPLTTVRQPIAEMAQAAVTAILDASSVIGDFEHTLIVRGSTSGSADFEFAGLDL